MQRYHLARRLLTLTMVAVFVISLLGCSSTNRPGPSTWLARAFRPSNDALAGNQICQHQCKHSCRCNRQLAVSGSTPDFAVTPSDDQMNDEMEVVHDAQVAVAGFQDDDTGQEFTDALDNLLKESGVDDQESDLELGDEIQTTPAPELDLDEPAKLEPQGDMPNADTSTDIRQPSSSDYESLRDDAQDEDPLERSTVDPNPPESNPTTEPESVYSDGTIPFGSTDELGNAIPSSETSPNAGAYESPGQTYEGELYQGSLDEGALEPVEMDYNPGGCTNCPGGCTKSCTQSCSQCGCSH